MTTTRDERQGGNDHPRWQALKRSFAQSNYVTDVWNWLLTLLSKAADCVLFASILYSSYQLFPGVPHASAGFDAGMFLAQQAALDIGGLGLLKLAKRANLAPSSFPMRVGITLVTLMIFNVVLASLKHALAFLPDAFFLTVETMLLVARAVMAVLFGYAIHALREEHGDSMLTIADARVLHRRLEAVAHDLQELTHATVPAYKAELSHEVAQKLSQVESRLHARLTENAQGLRQSFQEELNSVREAGDENTRLLLRESSTAVEQRLHARLVESSAALETSLQERLSEHAAVMMQDVHNQLLAELSQLSMQLQQDQELLSSVPELQSQIGLMQQQVQALQRHLHAPQKRPDAVVIRAFQPASEKRHKGTTGAVIKTHENTAVTAAEEKFDTRGFVFSCLQHNAGLKLADIAALAGGEGQTLSLPTISRYRKQFFDTRENSAVVGEELIEQA
jgi:hypothetical protein